mmetsp:Transcript_40513/g.67882  ORF Transcript_40513/g.67882 Transcript_40513/m.67882 type:complete len:374 (-) Transcript_40513:311-1432(-)|eukprot:CAMPEP_0198206540 /NCGR_PEP_ID=MMETSP1445-20131203/10089_1 /TAXON_ID=36898 /ORGANISM="Pyramimonas sp., Strain CCMP2087" /LENGTH=373 /DNA_ID=CAMNT_0043879283 /DNA_START=118 /DNA_END=1239 /DNA_ORIENTATION=-
MTAAVQQQRSAFGMESSREFACFLENKKMTNMRPLPRCCPGGGTPDVPEKGKLRIYNGHASQRYIDRLRAQATARENEETLPQLGRYSREKSPPKARSWANSPAETHCATSYGAQEDRSRPRPPLRIDVTTASYTSDRKKGFTHAARGCNKVVTTHEILSGKVNHDFDLVIGKPYSIPPTRERSPPPYSKYGMPPHTPRHVPTSAFSFSSESPTRHTRHSTGRLLSPTAHAGDLMPPTPHSLPGRSPHTRSVCSLPGTPTRGSLHSPSTKAKYYSVRREWRRNYVDVVLHETPRQPSYVTHRTAVSLSDYVSISGAVSCQEDSSHLPVELRAMSPNRKAKAIQANLTRKLYNRGWDPRATSSGLFGSYGLQTA